MSTSDNAHSLRREILQWVAPPEGPRRGHIQRHHAMRLLRALEDPGAARERYLSALAEAECARRMLRAGCMLEVEAATPSGHHADFRVLRGGTEFYVHIKRLWMGEHAPTPPVPELLRGLERAPSALSLAIWWNPDATEAELEHLRARAEAFLPGARVGDEMSAHHDGVWIGSCRATGPSSAEHATVAAEDPRTEEVAVPRAQRLLRRAYGQFMPGHPNVICVVGDDPHSAHALERALLGTVVERWDRFPPRGHRVAHGRADDGFWARGQFESCHLVAWFSIHTGHPPTIWRREGSRGETDVEEVLRSALYSSPDAAPPSSGSPTA